MDDPEAPGRELTLDEAVALAILLQQGGQFVEAQEVYRRVLAADPAHPRALHYAGVLAHQLGQHTQATDLIERSVLLEPSHADWHSNLGIVLQATGKIESAVDQYHRAIEIDPAHANAYSNLGVVLRATGKPVEAEAAYRTAIQLNREHIDAYTNLGILLNGLGRTEEAAACYCKVITLRPKHREARKLLALAHCALGEVGEAIRIFDEWLAEDPGDPIALHMRAACTGQDVPPRASNGFIVNTFDGFAASFESKLQKLSYRAPSLIAAMLDDSGLEPLRRLDILDAGCGTGLCGALVAPYAKRLVGVDLSEAMLALAREKNVYDELRTAELTGFLRNNGDAFDLIVAADTLVYFGSLEEILAAAAGSLRANGRIVFTLEHATPDHSRADYRLEYHGRYSHRRAYVERVLACLNVQTTIVEADLRMESGAPVGGLVVGAMKAATST